jgi:2-polyprenyl-3-methyl-5-hydroxy-6-metoxy-1,4-benzoquinol methylase
LNTSINDLDKIADEYHLNENNIPDIHIENLCQKYFINWLLNKVNKNQTILELGYGDGIVCEALYNNFSQNYSLIEGSTKLANKAKLRHKNLNCHTELFENFSPSSKFDFVLAAHVLEHLDNPVKLLLEMRDWLTENGRLIIVVPNRNSLHRQLAVLMGLQPELDTLSPRDHLVGHKRVYSLDSLKKDISDAGYKIDVELGFFVKPLPNSMMINFSTDLLWAMNDLSKDIPTNLTANLCLLLKL